MLNAYKSAENWKKVQNKKKHSRTIYKAGVAYCNPVEGQGGIPIWETGASATTWQEGCLQDLRRRYYEVHLDQCAYGCVHPKSGRPVQKKTKSISTSPKILQLQHCCKCKEQHDHAKRGSHITGPLAFCPKQMCIKIASLIVPFKDKIYRHEDNIMQVDSALFEYADDDALVHQEDDEDVGGHADWKKTRLEGKDAVTRRLRRVHENLGHASYKLMAQILSRTKAPLEVIQIVKNMECKGM